MIRKNVAKLQGSRKKIFRLGQVKLVDEVGCFVSIPEHK